MHFRNVSHTKHTSHQKEGGWPVSEASPDEHAAHQLLSPAGSCGCSEGAMRPRALSMRQSTTTEHTQLLFHLHPNTVLQKLGPL